MRNGFFGSLMILVATASLVLSDDPRSSGPARGNDAGRAKIDLSDEPRSSSPAPTPKAVRYGSVSHPGDEPRSSGPGASSPINDQAPPLPENGATLAGAGEPPYFANRNGAAGGRIWGSAEFLQWRIKDGNVPPLATTSPPDSFGVLGAPGTTTLFDNGQDYGHHLGARFTIGAWLDSDGRKGVELSYFFLCANEERSDASSSGEPGSAVLARPFFNVISGLPDSQVFAFPGLAGGSIQTTANSEKKLLQGADLNLFCNLCCGPACAGSYRLDLLAGVRWLQLNEDLEINEQVMVPDPAVGFAVSDRFETRNTFLGGQIGTRAEWQSGRWFVNVLGKVALGVTRQEVSISGSTVITVPGAAPVVQQGGFLALPTNIGNYSRDTFSVVPELGIRTGCQVTNCLRAYVGYTCLYWSRVVRPGDQIDYGINPTQLPSAEGPGSLVGPARPAFEFRDTCFWAQGVSVGVEFMW